MDTRRALAPLLLALVLAAPLPAGAQDGAGPGWHWVGSWATALVPRPSLPAGGRGGAQTALRFSNQTLRQIVRATVGGERVRVVVSNAFGTEPLRIGAARVALRQKEAITAPGSSRTLTFSGRTAALIPPGAVLVSDPVALRVGALSELAIDLFLPDDTGGTASPLTSHAGAQQTSYVSSPGDHTATAEFPVISTFTSWFFLARVEVEAPATVGAVAAFGDSITDGTRSTLDSHNRWPDHLARRLLEAGRPMGVLNMGIAGNRILSTAGSPGALARLERDVLTMPGLTHVVVMLGINDIGGAAATADDVIAGHRQIIERARADGLRVIGATLTPFEGATLDGYYSAEQEAARQAVNGWLRSSGGYDAIVDFDAVLRDPARPSRIRAPFTSPDNIHPNDAGYRAMAEAIQLAIFDLPYPARLTSK